MYRPKHFAEDDTDELYRLMTECPLATLVVSGASGLIVNHIPMILDQSTPDVAQLKGHIPRANPLSQYDQDQECVAIFHGPQGYVSPSWYATKQADGKVVPTWNYSVVHCYGRLTLVDDSDWVRGQINELTQQMEDGRIDAWSVSDAPEDYTSRMIHALIGLEFSIDRIIGKSKLSQNQPDANQQSVLASIKNEPGYSELLVKMKSELNSES